MKRDRSDPLEHYRSKRDFGRTPEPAGDVAASGDVLVYVIQKHAATRLHYDFRLELDGTMRSWAVPKGPSLDPSVKRMAIQVENHPMSYNSFEGTIPPKQYGAGTVIVWDRGSWLPQGDARAALEAGKLVFALEGEKLHGLWELVRIAKPGERQNTWLLFKKRDGYARPTVEYDVVSALPDSVITGPGRVRASTPSRHPAEPPRAPPRKKPAVVPALQSHPPPRIRPKALPACHSPPGSRRSSRR